MSRGLVLSPDYNLITTCWMMEAGVIDRDCDVFLMTQDTALAERLKKAGFFRRVFLFTDRDRNGRSFSQLDQAVDAALRGPARPFRRKADFMEFLSPARFYGPDTPEWDKCYSASTGFEPLFPQFRRVLWKKGAVSFWEHGLIYSVMAAQGRILPSFYFMAAQSLWLGLSGIAHPRDLLSEMIVSRPELLPGVCRSRTKVRAIPKIDRTDIPFRRTMNEVFGTTEETVFPQAVYFPGAIGSLQCFQPGEQRFLDRAASILGKNAIAVKEHPSTIYENRPPWRGVELLPDAGLPLELQVLNHAGWDRRLLIAPYCTAALLTPKAFFGDEPFVLNLTRLFPELNQESYNNELHLELSRMVGGLYRNPERYCIPETWDEAWEFLRAFKQQAL